jgi:predicted dehydrogenase
MKAAPRKQRMSLVKNPDDIRLGVAGMVEENGHPFSWSAIINGFDAKEMAKTAYPMIFNYLTAQNQADFGIPGVRVTHAWCDRPEDALQLSKASCIPNVVQHPQEMIGSIDAVLIPTDKGWEHVERARIFIEAGLPVFIDKPLVDREEDLITFIRWNNEGHAIMSTSMMRYCSEYAECRARLNELGSLRLIILAMAKSWERYGIHALEGAYGFLEPGAWKWVVNTGSRFANMVHIHHTCGTDVFIPTVEDMFGGFGRLSLYGSTGSLTAHTTEATRFIAFKRQLVDFVEYLRTGHCPVPFEQTVEIMKMVIAGIRSRDEGGRKILLSEIRTA